MRLRLFAAVALTVPPVRGYEGGIAPGANGEPRWGMTIDRLVDLPAPQRDGVHRVELLLSGQCYAVPADLRQGTTCVPQESETPLFDGRASDGVRTIAEPPSGSRVGTWRQWRTATAVPEMLSRREQTDAQTEESFVRGGFFYLGDERQSLAVCEPRCWTAPERATLVSSFYVDRYEVSVARWRAAIARGFSPRGRWFRNEQEPRCMYTDAAARRLLPMNCVSWTAAEEFCQFDGGRHVITEAQWEFIATGGGKEFAHPWGNALPTCERAIYARVNPGSPMELGTYTECNFLSARYEPLAVDSPQQDRSAFGEPAVIGLAGNVQEWNRDVTQYLFGSAYARGLLVDPFTPGAFFEAHSVRGGSFGHNSVRTYITIRDGRDDEWIDPNNFRAGRARNGEGWLGPAIGLRCARQAESASP
jgi:formylglycine-generating enzyme required for sulfatase activity